MAEEPRDLIEFVKEYEGEGEFRPYAYYGEEEDAFTFYFREAADYAKRLNSRVTVFLSLDDHELVGCQIKSVRSVLDDLGRFDVSIEDHKGTKLSMLFWAFRGTIEDPEAEELYRSVVKAAQEYGPHICV